MLNKSEREDRKNGKNRSHTQQQIYIENLRYSLRKNYGEGKNISHNTHYFFINISKMKAKHDLRSTNDR